MSITAPFLSKREIARAWQVIIIIGRYGLVPLAHASGLGRIFGVRYWRKTERRFQQLPPQVRLRLAITELGTTFIKLGQVLSARSDMLPSEYLDELSTLQDEVPPLPFEQMEPVFREEFGSSPKDAFQTFDPIPIASASIGQAYRATLCDGREVVVKIQRPGLTEQVNTDLLLMSRVAHFANKYTMMQHFDLPALVREFRFLLQDELIYTLEAYNAESLAKAMSREGTVAFQEIYWPFTSRRVMTTMYIEGTKITNTLELDKLGVDRRALATTLANNLLEQILLHGLFHGDPHPGNILVDDQGVIHFLDTGMVGRLDRKTRELLIELAVAIFDQDIDAILGHLEQLGVVVEAANLPELRRDLSRLIMKYYFLPRKELRLGELLQRMNNLLFEHDIRMAYEFGLLAKALFVVEGIAQNLDPDFDYNQAGRPVIEGVRRSYYSLSTFLDDSVREFRGLRRQIVDLPRRLSAVLNYLERGTTHIKLKDENWDIKESSENVLVNRMSFSIIIIGILIASAIVLAGDPSGWLRYLAITGLVSDGVLFIWLLFSVLRSGRI